MTQNNRPPRAAPAPTPPTASTIATTADVDVSGATAAALRDRYGADRYCPDCGTHYRADDVRWRDGTPICRVCGYRPLKKVER